MEDENEALITENRVAQSNLQLIGENILEVSEKNWLNEQRSDRITNVIANRSTGTVTSAANTRPIMATRTSTFDFTEMAGQVSEWIGACSRRPQSVKGQWNFTPQQGTQEVDRTQRKYGELTIRNQETARGRRTISVDDTRKTNNLNLGESLVKQGNLLKKKSNRPQSPLRRQGTPSGRENRNEDLPRSREQSGDRGYQGKERSLKLEGI